MGFAKLWFVCRFLFFWHRGCCRRGNFKKFDVMKISIITVCYNSVATLATAMESVLSQTYPNIEYIVVDGGSADGTFEKTKGYKRKFEAKGYNMKVLSETDDGMYDAINKGVRLATGDIVGILNADDLFESEGVIAVVANTFQADIDAVYADVRFVSKDTNGKTLRYYSSKYWQPWMLRWGFMPPHPSVYIRRECFERLGLYKIDYHIAADYELLIRYLWKAGLKTAYMPRCLVTMRMGGKSTKSWRSNLLLNQEIVRGNRENGYFCCLPMLLPKYLFKVWEFIIPFAGAKRF
jgi:glycosyltransferase involved in cell wall biosynthesis